MKKLTKSIPKSRAKSEQNYAASINEARPTNKKIDYEARLELIRQAVEKRQPMHGSLIIGSEIWQ